jgi:hypothetical protein
VAAVIKDPPPLFKKIVPQTNYSTARSKDIEMEKIDGKFNNESSANKNN